MVDQCCEFESERKTRVDHNPSRYLAILQRLGIVVPGAGSGLQTGGDDSLIS
jgi:hypothetical protein